MCRHLEGVQRAWATFSRISWKGFLGVRWSQWAVIGLLAPPSRLSSASGPRTTI